MLLQTLFTSVDVPGDFVDRTISAQAVATGDVLVVLEVPLNPGPIGELGKADSIEAHPVTGELKLCRDRELGALNAGGVRLIGIHPVLIGPDLFSNRAGMQGGVSVSPRGEGGGVIQDLP